MDTRTALPGKQDGFMLLEALISILIFSIGILGIVALQAVSIKNAGDAKYRSDASLLSNKLLAQMWVSDRNPAALQAKFSSAAAGAAYVAWSSDVAAALPGAIPPIVTFATVNATVTPSSIVTITIYWKAPNELPAAAPHKFVAIAQVV